MQYRGCDRALESIERRLFPFIFGFLFGLPTAGIITVSKMFLGIVNDLIFPWFGLAIPLLVRRLIMLSSFAAEIESHNFSLCLPSMTITSNATAGRGHTLLTSAIACTGQGEGRESTQTAQSEGRCRIDSAQVRIEGNVERVTDYASR